MKTTYGTKLKWRFEDVDEGTYELNRWPFTFTIFKPDYWIQQYEVYVSSEYLLTEETPRLYYLTDEFGWYESLEKAKRAVETFLSNELKIDFDFLDCNHI